MNWLTTFLQSFSRILQWWVIVAPWEQGLRVRLGKVATVLVPGVHMRIPFLDRIYVQSVRLRTIYDNNQTVTTRDGHALTITIAIDFAIGDIRKLYDAMSNPEVTLQSKCASNVARYISSHDRENVNAIGIETAARSELNNMDAGLVKLDARVMQFAFVRTYRIIQSDYRIYGGLYDFEQEHSGLR